jgi:peptidoglycan/LPS O-acetylase OafA/YrhL
MGIGATLGRLGDCAEPLFLSFCAMSSLHTNATPTRRQALDFLRAIAVLLVLFRHAPPAGAWAGGFSDALVVGGWIGVDLFFVLSGYLVSGLIWQEVDRTGRFDAWRFLVRRGLKIYPAFYVMLLFSILMLLIRPGFVEVKSVLAEVFFVQNYVSGIWNHTWSLAVEEHFYLLLTGLVYLCFRFGKNAQQKIFVACLICIFACLLARLNLSSTTYAHETHLFPTHLRIDALAFGVLLQLMLRYSPGTAIKSSLLRIALVVLALALSLWAFFYPLGSAPWISSVGLSMLSLSAFMLIYALESWPAFERLSMVRALAAIGVYSYSIYLWHIPLNHLMHGVIKRLVPNLTLEFYYCIYFLIAVTGGVVLGKLIELPFLRQRDKWFPSKSSP